MPIMRRRFRNMCRLGTRRLEGRSEVAWQCTMSQRVTSVSANQKIGRVSHLEAYQRTSFNICREKSGSVVMGGMVRHSVDWDRRQEQGSNVEKTDGVVEEKNEGLGGIPCKLKLTCDLSTGCCFDRLPFLLQICLLLLFLNSGPSNEDINSKKGGWC
jgi:hypothetical protein